MKPSRWNGIRSSSPRHAFLDAVEGKYAVPVRLDDGLQTLKVNLAALASLERGEWQELI